MNVSEPQSFYVSCAKAKPDQIDMGRSSKEFFRPRKFLISKVGNVLMDHLNLPKKNLHRAYVKVRRAIRHNVLTVLPR